MQIPTRSINCTFFCLDGVLEKTLLEVVVRATTCLGVGSLLVGSIRRSDLSQEWKPRRKKHAETERSHVREILDFTQAAPCLICSTF